MGTGCSASSSSPRCHMCPYPVITSPAPPSLGISPPKLLLYPSSPLPWHPSLSSIAHSVPCPTLELSRSFQERSGLGPSPALLEQRDVKMSGEVAASAGDIGPAAPGQSSGLCALASACKEAVDPHTEGERPALLVAPNACVNVSAFVLNTPVLTGLS